MNLSNVNIDTSWFYKYRTPLNPDLDPATVSRQSNLLYPRQQASLSCCKSAGDPYGRGVVQGGRTRDRRSGALSRVQQ
jgi:hypothetical protein